MALEALHQYDAEGNRKGLERELLVLADAAEAAAATEAASGDEVVSGVSQAVVGKLVVLLRHRQWSKKQALLEQLTLFHAVYPG